VNSILDHSLPSLGIDLGLRTFAAFTDEALPPIEAERFYRDLEPALAHAQRARHRNRTRAIHAKIANRRKDFLHKVSTGLVKANGAIFVGNVNASLLQRLDWPSRCSMRVGVHSEPCCCTNAMTQACGLMKSMKRFPPRPAAGVTAAPALEAGKILE
jgi:hypothetical protein